MNNEIVGIRYVGKKPRQEDTVCKTGAVWLPGQVHNFSAVMAKALLVHTDSFAKAPISMDGGTFLTQGKGRAMNKSHDVAAFVNLNGMGIDQLVLFARRELDRVVQTDGKDEATIRREVHFLMTNHSLDQEAERKQEEQAEGGRIAVMYQATAEECAALRDGTVRLAIVPVEVMMAATDGEPQTAIGGSTENAGADAAEANGNAGSGDQAVPLDTLLASLEKKELMEFARQEGVSFSNNITAEKLRERLFEELTARSAAAEQQGTT
jgi:hypothetical protein